MLRSLKSKKTPEKERPSLDEEPQLATAAIGMETVAKEAASKPTVEPMESAATFGDAPSRQVTEDVNNHGYRPLRTTSSSSAVL